MHFNYFVQMVATCRSSFEIHFIELQRVYVGWQWKWHSQAHLLIYISRMIVKSLHQNTLFLSFIRWNSWFCETLNFWVFIRAHKNFQKFKWKIDSFWGKREHRLSDISHSNTIKTKHQSKFFFNGMLLFFCFFIFYFAMENVIQHFHVQGTSHSKSSLFTFYLKANLQKHFALFHISSGWETDTRAHSNHILHRWEEEILVETLCKGIIVPYLLWFFWNLLILWIFVFIISSECNFLSNSTKEKTRETKKIFHK